MPRGRRGLGRSLFFGPLRPGTHLAKEFASVFQGVTANERPVPRFARDGERDGGEMLGNAIREVGLALRRMQKRPGFAFAGILTLGLGLGATTAIFSVLNTVILRH